MSAQAIRHVINYAPEGGTELLVMIAIASKCTQKFDPFTASISGKEIAKLARIGLRQAKLMTARLEKSGAIKQLQRGGGTSSNLYLLRVRFRESKGDQS